MAERLGVAIVGVGGAVATTAIAGIEMIKAGSNSFDGLPLGKVETFLSLSNCRCVVSEAHQ